MKNSIASKGRSESPTRIWFALIVLTALTFGIGEQEYGGMFVMFAVLLVMLIKGQLIADYFMGLHQVRLFWRATILVYLALVGVLIAIAYFIAPA